MVWFVYGNMDIETAISTVECAILTFPDMLDVPKEELTECRAICLPKTEEI
jgi:hypothetical protein